MTRFSPVLLLLLLSSAFSQQLKFANTYSSAGKGAYLWTVYVNANQPTLQQISCVQYQLHPSFPNPIQKVCSPATKFALSERGWGEFTIFITVYWKNGHVTRQSFPLNLHSHFSAK